MDVNEIIRTAELYPPANAGEIVDADFYVDEEDAQVRTGFRIENLPTADWSGARLTALRQQEADVDAMVAAAVARIQKRGEQLKENIRRGIAFFEGLLAEYATRERKTLLGGGKKKSRDLLNCTIGWRKKGGRLAVTDKAALLAWLEAQPPESGLYRFKIEPEMRAIQDIFKASGEIPPGCEYELEEEVFYVKTPETALVKE